MGLGVVYHVAKLLGENDLEHPGALHTPATSTNSSSGKGRLGVAERPRLVWLTRIRPSPGRGSSEPRARGCTMKATVFRNVSLLPALLSIGCFPYVYHEQDRVLIKGVDVNANIGNRKDDELEEGGFDATLPRSGRCRIKP